MEEEKKPEEMGFKAEFHKRMGEKYPDMEEEDMYKTHLDHLDNADKIHQGNKELNEKLTQHPKAAMFLADVVDGKHPAVAMKRYFDDSEVNVEEGSEAYEQLLEAERDRIAESENSKRMQQEYEDNLKESESTVQAFKESKQMEDAEFEEFIGKAVEKVSELLSGKLSDELLEVFYKGLNYDHDTEMAKEAGRIGGRNEKIEAKKVSMQGDGLPNTSNVQSKEPQPQSKPSFLDRKSVWEK